MMKGLAAERFPGDPKAFGKFVNGEGAELNTAIVRAEHAAQQHATAVGDGYAAAAKIRKDRGSQEISASATGDTRGALEANEGDRRRGAFAEEFREGGSGSESLDNAAGVLEKTAQDWAREHKVSLSEAYDGLLKTKFGQLLMTAAKAQSGA
jgi:hypothetical protein